MHSAPCTRTKHMFVRVQPPTQVIRRHFPDHAVLGEEGGITGDTASDYLW